VWRLFGGAVVALVGAACLADETHVLGSGGRERSYIVHVPPGHPGDKGWPVVLAFHGGGSNARTMVQFSGLSGAADECGFIAVYPSGPGRLPRMLAFNGGICCGHAMQEGVDDVAFVDALIDDLAGRHKVDLARVYATGMSNGGIMCYLLGSKLAHRIAAIAPVGGTMGTETCEPVRPVPVMHFHGTEDAYLRYGGGPGPKSVAKAPFFSVEHSIRAWVKANGCDPEPREELLPDASDDGTRVRQFTYSGGRAGSEVILIRIEGGGHTWPGGATGDRTAFLGTTTRDISANRMMWEFFQRHPLRVGG